MPGEDKSPPMDNTSNTTQSSSAAVNGGSAPATVSTATAKVQSQEDIISDGEAWKTRRKMLGLPEVVDLAVKEKTDSSMGRLPKFSGEGESHIARCWWEAVLAHRWASGWSEATTICAYCDSVIGRCCIDVERVFLENYLLEEEKLARQRLLNMIQGANESIEAYTRRMRYTYEQVYGSVHDVNAMRNLIETMISHLLHILRLFC
ncbi:hypothetical protein Pelo_1464 [Pelomyxa schiedti]|nr:hypothetical protein Pelo_1464 [Pelomyxa schiedti]